MTSPMTSLMTSPMTSSMTSQMTSPSTTNISGDAPYNTSNSSLVVHHRWVKDDLTLASDAIQKYFLFLLLVCGTVGNVLCLAVLSRRTFRRSAIGVYLSFLALADLAALWTGCMWMTSKALFDLDLRQLSEISCKVHIWLSFSTCDVASWALVLVSSARCLSVVWPFKRLLTRRRAYISIVSLVTVVLIVNSPLLIYYEDFFDTYKNRYKRCSVKRENFHFRVDVWPWVVLVKFAVLPMALLIFLNVCLLYSLNKTTNEVKGNRVRKPSILAKAKSKLRQVKMRSDKYKLSSSSSADEHNAQDVDIKKRSPTVGDFQTETTNDSIKMQKDEIELDSASAPVTSDNDSKACLPVPGSPEVTLGGSTTSLTSKASKTKVKADAKSSSSSNNSNKAITRTIVLINVMFLIFNTPIVIFLIVPSGLMPRSSRKLFESIANSFMYTNNTINFLLYCVTGTLFKRELKAMFHDVWSIVTMRRTCCDRSDGSSSGSKMADSRSVVPSSRV